MNFALPQILWLTLAPVALLAWEIAAKRRPESATHPKILRAEAGIRDVSLVPQGPARQLRRRIWLAAGVTLAIVALARPQWGQIDEPLFNQSREIVIAMDLSRSMLAGDVVPSRLEREKLLVQSLLNRLAGERVGLVVFAGTAFVQSPLTTDYEIIREFLPALGPDFLPVGGTHYGAMIDAAADAFGDGTNADRYLIVLSDGGANDKDWRDHLGKLKDKGVRVIGLGIGTAAGGFIPDVDGGFMKDKRGAVVLAKLESGTLQELAAKTGGAYRDAGQWVDLAGLLKSTVESGRKGKFVEKRTQRYIERYQWALAPALFCLLMSFWRELPVQPRPRDIRLTAKHALILAFPLLLLPRSAKAEATATSGAEGPDSGAMLGRIVGRLSSQDHASALDWAELGRQTASWGQQLQSANQPVKPGPVRDALAAVDAGSALDPSVTDWSRLRSDLEALLKKPEEQKKKDQQQNQQNKQQKNQQQSQPQSQQQNQQPSQQQEQQQGRQDNQAESKPGQPQPSPAENPSTADNEGNRGGDTPAPDERKAAPQPLSGDSQRVGGYTERKSRDPARADPSLAIPLQKLEQVRNQDSPSELYQMIENHEPRPAPADDGDNW